MKRPGPKPRGPYADKRKAFTTRVTDSTRKGLDRAAKMSGRSLSQEVELRLERSLSDDAVMDMLAAIAERLERVEQILWERVPYTPSPNAVIEGALVTPKEQKELGITLREMREQARKFYNGDPE